MWLRLSRDDVEAICRRQGLEIQNRTRHYNIKTGTPQVVGFPKALRGSDVVNPETSKWLQQNCPDDPLIKRMLANASRKERPVAPKTHPVGDQPWYSLLKRCAHVGIVASDDGDRWHLTDPETKETVYQLKSLLPKVAWACTRLVEGAESRARPKVPLKGGTDSPKQILVPVTVAPPAPPAPPKPIPVVKPVLKAVSLPVSGKGGGEERQKGKDMPEHENSRLTAKQTFQLGVHLTQQWARIEKERPTRENYCKEVEKVLGFKLLPTQLSRVATSIMNRPWPIPLGVVRRVPSPDGHIGMAQRLDRVEEALNRLLVKLGEPPLNPPDDEEEGTPS